MLKRQWDTDNHGVVTEKVLVFSEVAEHAERLA